MYSGDTGPYGQGNRPTGLYGYENHTLGAVAASAGAALPVSHRPGSGGGDAGLSLLPSQQQPTYGYAPPTAYPPTAYTYDYSHMGTAPALAGGGGGGGERGHRFCAVRLRGLPFGVHEHEIASFLVRFLSLYTHTTPFFAHSVTFTQITVGSGSHRYITSPTRRSSHWRSLRRVDPSQGSRDGKTER